MESVPRNVILDLLPAYLAGEASEESRALVEEFARHDPQIARLIRAGTLDPAAAKVAAPDDLEMMALKRVRGSIRRQLVYVAMATVCLLMIPLLTGMDWDETDFIVMGILLFGAGLAYVLISRMSDKVAYRIAVGLAALAGFLLMWVNLAVGIIGSEDNPANLLFLAVPATAVIGAVGARFKPRGMMRAMFATAAVQFLVPVTALIIWRPSLDNAPGIVGVFMMNAFWVTLFTVSGLLFRWAGDKAAEEKPKE